MQDNTIGDSHLEDMVEFVDNPEPRCPCVLLLDVSGSMTGSRIQALNDGIRAFKEEVTADSLTALRAEVAVVAFNHEVNVVQDFVTADEFQPTTLSASGGTCIAAALNLGLEMIDERKRAYRANGIAYYRPIVMLLTDGEPEHDTEEAIQEATQRVREAEDGRHAAIFSFGIDEEANIARLSSMMAPQRPAKPLHQAQLSGIFQWLSNSLSQISSSQVGDRLTLPSQDDYLDF